VVTFSCFHFVCDFVKFVRKYEGAADEVLEHRVEAFGPPDSPLIQRLVPRVNDIGEEVKREPELSGMAWCRRFAHP